MPIGMACLATRRAPAGGICRGDAADRGFHRVAMADPAQWFHESFDLAKQFVYTDEIGLGAGPFTLSAGYDAKARDLAKVQAGVAGARLAQLLNYALKD